MDEIKKKIDEFYRNINDLDHINNVSFEILDDLIEKMKVIKHENKRLNDENKRLNDEVQLLKQEIEKIRSK